MKKVYKRIISFALASAIILSMLPASMAMPQAEGLGGGAADPFASMYDSDILIQEELSARMRDEVGAQQELEDAPYDPKSRASTLMDARGLETTYHYDALQRLVKTEDEEGYSENTFNSDGRLAARKDRLGNVTAYEYFGNGNVKKITYPDLSAEEYTYPK